MADSRSPSVPTDPSDPQSVQRWLTERTDQLSTIIARRLNQIVVGAYREFLATLPETAITAAGDLSALDSIPGRWRTVITDEISDELGETYLAGSLSAFGIADGHRAVPDRIAQSWARVVNTQAVDYMTSANNRLMGVGDTVWGDVRGRVTDALSRGASNEELKDQIAAVTRFTEYRADTIARTETMGAYVNGDMTGMLALGEYGPAEKVWRATQPPPRGRAEHWALEGTYVAMDQTFDVDGESMMFPHDPMASAANVVNCRCYVEFLFVGDTRPDGSIVGQDDVVDEATDEVYDPETDGTDLEPSMATEMIAETIGDPVPAYGPGPLGTESPRDVMSIPNARAGSTTAERVDAANRSLDLIGQLHGMARVDERTDLLMGGKTDSVGGFFRFRRKYVTDPATGQTVTKKDVSITLNRARGDDNLLSHMSTFIHEYGHRVDWDGNLGFVSTMEYERIKDFMKLHGRGWVDKLDEITDPLTRAFAELSIAYRDSDAFAALGQIRGNTKFKNYHSSIEEVWARAYQGWVPRATGAADVIAGEASKATWYLFTDQDMATIGPIVERIMRLRGLMS